MNVATTCPLLPALASGDGHRARLRRLLGAGLVALAALRRDIGPGFSPSA